jgi:hypothetical protein
MQISFQFITNFTFFCYTRRAAAVANTTPPAPIQTRKVLIQSKSTPCSAPAEMDLADFCLAMERLFWIKCHSSDNSCPAAAVTEEAGTQRPIINISAARENKGWLAPVENDGVLMILAVDTGADI